MLAKAWNDFSTPTRKHSCRLSSCVSACPRCVSVNRRFVLSCRRSLIRPTIGRPSCDWRRLSRRSSHACAVLLRRLMSQSASESYGSWSKTSWWGTTPSPFVTASQSHRVPHKTAVRRQVGQMIKVTFCVRGVMAALGAGAGLVAALALTRLMGTMLYAISAADPLTYLCVVVLLFAVSMAACWLPARRAAGINPVDALRHE